ncbi:alpha/beta fold hydrolase [Neolewinella persica]|uniref:alpha/beta fold hydrolase n=1 Tax=Neolewinella persica TaxID=70998 RepID=UPI0003627025|nr:alpha/beta fold hydrolase [Neolewinella persica]
MLNAKTFGNGPTLVILHGLFGMLDNWQTLARLWAETHQVVLLDLRNHGRSFHADEMNYGVMAEDVAVTLEDMGIDECVLLGHSMGGKVAMQTAITYPDLVQKLIVVDIVPRRYHPGHNTVFAALNALDPATLTDRKDAAEEMSVHLADPGVQLFLLKNLTRNPAGGYRWRMNLPAISAAYDQLIGPVGQLGDLYDGPALFIRGEKSGYVQDEDLELIQILFPKATLKTVADAGHWVHAEQPEALMEVVNRFL